MSKVKVQHEGKEIEVELEGYVAQSDIDAKYVAKEKVDSIVKDEKAKAKRAALTGALNDNDFKMKAIETWGIDTSKNAGGEKLSDQQITAMKQELEKKMVSPLTEQLAARDATLTKLQNKILQKSILAAASAHKVRPELLATLPGGRQPAIVTMLETAFALHDEDGEFYVKKQGGDGFEPSSHTERLYANIDDYFGTISKDKQFAQFFDRQTQTVGGAKEKSGASDSPGVVANDPMSIGANLEGIASGKLVVAGTGA